MGKKGKQSKASPVIDVDDRSKSLYIFIKKMLKNLKENKEAYAIICGAFGVMFATLWNFACDIGIRGYTDIFLVKGLKNKLCKRE